MTPDEAQLQYLYESYKMAVLLLAASEVAKELYHVIMAGNTRSASMLAENKDRLSPQAYKFLHGLQARRDGELAPGDQQASMANPMYPANYRGVRQDTVNAEASMEMYNIIIAGNTRSADLLELSKGNFSPEAYDFLREIQARRDAGSTSLGTMGEEALLRNLVGWKSG